MAALASPDLPLEPAEGIYLRLPNADYHRAGALGASDFATLDRDPASWWYGSRHNTWRRVRRDRPHLNFGSALHALVLEGEDAYAAQYAVAPDDDDPGYARNIFEIKQLLTERGVATRGVMDPAEIHALARQHGLAPKVWTLATREYEQARKQGRASLTADEDRRIRRMAHLLAQHPDLGPGLRQGLPEVSVFWRRPAEPDILLRARFDRLLPRAIVDLKSMANPRGLAPRRAAQNAIADHDYDLAVPHYSEARQQLRRFLGEGRIFYGAADNGPASREDVLASERAILAEIAAVESWRWIWVFYQVQRDDEGSERAPVVVPRWVDCSGPWYEAARATVERALANYRRMRDRFGLLNGWHDIEPIEELPADPMDRLARQRRDA